MLGMQYLFQVSLRAGVRKILDPSRFARDDNRVMSAGLHSRASANSKLKGNTRLDMPIEYWWLLPLGVLIGAFGTLIGAGGGFILVPILLLVYPNENTELITAISLAVVFFNALSGSFAYARMKRVDYKSGIIFAIATIPGAILGALSTAYVPRRAFDLIFGVLMVVAAVFLWLSAKEEHSTSPTLKISPVSEKAATRLTERHLVDAEGAHYHYAFDLRIGVILSVFVGYLSSLLGVGRRFHPCAGVKPLVEFSGPYRDRNFTLCSSHHGPDRNSGSCCTGRVCSRPAAHSYTGRWCLGRRPSRSLAIQPHRRENNYSRTRRCAGVRRYSTHLLRILKAPSSFDSERGMIYSAGNNWIPLDLGRTP